MGIAVQSRVDASGAERAAESKVRVWNPLHLGLMIAILVSFITAWWWYQQLEAFKSGLDATDPMFDQKWMPVWYLNCALAAVAQSSIPVYFWFTRDRDLKNLAPAVELRRYFTMFAFLVTFALGTVIAISFGTADAAWHQVVVRDTSLTPSHIVLFFGIVPLQTCFGMSAFFYSLTRIPQFANKLSIAMVLSFTGPFMTLPSVAYNEWGHAYWLMEELFIAPLHWGFVILGWSFLALLAVIAQSMPRFLELFRLTAPPVPVAAEAR